MLVVLKIFYFLALIFILKASIPPNQPLSVFLKDGRNFSSPQPQLQPPDNRTIQNFVETYVDSYIGGYAVARRKDLFTDTAAILKTIRSGGKLLCINFPPEHSIKLFQNNGNSKWPPYP